MTTKHFSNLQSALAIIALLYCGTSIATEKLMPWDFDSNIYREALSESIDQGHVDELLYNKKTVG